MPNQRKSKGGKHQRGKQDFSIKRELPIKEADQMYGIVIKILGTGRFIILCDDKKQRLCHIRGNMYKKVWINIGDTILISIRQFDTDKGDIILKYTPEETRRLRNIKEIPDDLVEENQEGQEIQFTE